MYANSSEPELDLDKEYLPTLNTRRFQGLTTEEVLAKCVEAGLKDTKKAREKYNVRENVRYGGEDDNQILDIYFKGEEKDTPIFVFVHGGYWKFMDKSACGSFASLLVDLNYRVLIVDYNLCPRVTLEQLTKQMWNFYEWLFKYTEDTNADKISICGHSAGAHLTAVMFNSKLLGISNANKLKSCFLISGVYDLRELWKLETVNTKNIFSLQSTKDAYELSPICWHIEDKLREFFNNNEIKMHVLVGEFESNTFIEQSRVYANKLKDVGIDATFMIMEGYDHFNIVEQATDKDSVIARYVIDNV